MIRSLTMPTSTIGENPLHFPMPADGGAGTVTVLCGPNGSGKSFILRMLMDLLGGGAAATLAEGRGWSADTTGAGTFSSHRPSHHRSQMSSLGTISPSRAGKILQAHDRNLRVQHTVFGLLIPSLGTVTGFDPTRWEADAKYRKTVVESIGRPDDEEALFWCGTDLPPFAKLFEEMFDCRLGMRRTRSAVELVLGLDSGITAPFANWSDGQMSYFTVLATTQALKPDVYIFDEVENFMHPALISRTIDHLKHNCRQTILSSHHPHLIFGRAVDAVFYVEPMPAERPSFAGRVLKFQSQPSAPRKITRLEHDRAKLASAYRLFDVRDAALLATAALVRSSVDLHLNEAVRALFECGAAPARGTPFMDRQTEEIANFIASFSPQPRRVLDWGAGLGRSLKEMSKRSIPPEEELAWLLYEPDDTTRRALAGQPMVDGVRVEAVGDRATLEGAAAGLALLTNVLHVLDPEGWCDALSDAWNAVRSAERGLILVTEIHPLLAPERQATPVPREWLADLFTTLGFKVAVRCFSTDGAESYCLAASSPPATPPDRDTLRRTVLDAWHTLGRLHLRAYEGVGRVTSLADQRALLNATFGLARVTSCLAAAGQGSATPATGTGWQGGVAGEPG